MPPENLSKPAFGSYRFSSRSASSPLPCYGSRCSLSNVHHILNSTRDYSSPIVDHILFPTVVRLLRSLSWRTCGGEVQALAFAGGGVRRAPVKFFPSNELAQAGTWLAG